MRLQIKNIGAIGSADISLEGITIIAGENNMGKSTVGKTLYAFLHDMSIWSKLYDEIRNGKIEHFLYQYSSVLEDWCMRESGTQRRRTSKAKQLQWRYANNENFIVAVEDFQLAEEEKEDAEAALKQYLSEYCFEYIRLYLKGAVSDLLNSYHSMISEWSDKAAKGIQLLELDELEIQVQKIKQSMQEVFHNQYKKIGTSDSEIKLQDDDNREVRFIMDNTGERLDQPLRISRRIYFIESPKIYDYLSDTRYSYVQKEYLRYLMSPNVFKKGNLSPRIEREGYVEAVDSCNKKLQNISEKLQYVMGGKAEFLQKAGLEFKDEHIAETIHSANVSTGLKSMALLEYALRIGAIEEGDILILDEPEINLHPEWQVEYARALVSLQKIFDLKIIVTTHSPYFMRAIECFSDIENTMDVLNVYRMSRETESGSLTIENVSYSEYGITELYDDLSAPLEKLEELLEEKAKREQTGDGAE